MELAKFECVLTIQTRFHMVVQQPPTSSENLMVIFVLVSSFSSLTSSFIPQQVITQVQQMGEVILHELSMRD